MVHACRHYVGFGLCYGHYFFVWNFKLERGRWEWRWSRNRGDIWCLPSDTTMGFCLVV